MKTNEKFFGGQRLLIWVSLLAIVIFIFWSRWAELDQITRATGQVIASSRNQVIQTTDGGVISEILVREGAFVKKNQVLVRFDQVKAKANYQESATKAAALRATVARLNAEVFGGEPNFPLLLKEFPDFLNNQLSLFKKRKDALKEEISALSEAQKLILEELEMNLPLIKTGDVSQSDILRLKRQAVEIQAQITNKKNKYLQDSQAELTKAEEDLAGVVQIAKQRFEQLQATELTSPMDGVVRNIKITTIGGVARPGDEVMQIVPVEDELVIEAKIRPADVTFIKPGLSATIKFDAYDYSIYGTITGEVIYISADTITEVIQGVEQPFYRLQAKTRGKELVNKLNKQIYIQPGMTATIEIKTGEKSVFDYLVKPITKTLSESLAER